MASTLLSACGTVHETTYTFPKAKPIFFFLFIVLLFPLCLLLWNHIRDILLLKKAFILEKQRTSLRPFPFRGGVVISLIFANFLRAYIKIISSPSKFRRKFHRVPSALIKKKVYNIIALFML
jgi:hypothetical protein